MVTIQEALQAVKGATSDDVAIILDKLGAEGFTGDKPAEPDSAFLALDAGSYKDTLNLYHRSMISAAQRMQGGVAGVLPGCLLGQGTAPWTIWSWTGALLLLQRAGGRDAWQQMPSLQVVLLAMQQHAAHLGRRSSG